jgi:hypothetical protein
MTRARLHKTSFAAGEISPRLLGRGDLRAYDNGALRLRNVLIDPTGGIRRRPGLAFVDLAGGPGRLVAFEFSTEQTYLLAFSDGRIDVYRGDEAVASVPAPWTAAQIAGLSWTQSADTLLLCHPEVPPRRLTRTGASTWTLAEWEFRRDGVLVRQPWYRFAGPGVTLAPSGTAGLVTLAASAPAFLPGQVDARIRIRGVQAVVRFVASPTAATVELEGTLPSAAATLDWDEQAFSAARGWPVSAAFHQDRLVIGGSRDLPNRLWLSRSADIWNFDLGAGEDDQAIEFGILSDQVNAVRAVFSGRHLQVLTSGAEWMVTGEPLTPKSIQLDRQTRVGSPTDRHVPPRDVDGATLFVSRDGRELRELLYADAEQAYQATDLALLARHLVDRPVDQDYDKARRLMLVAMEGGALGALTLYRQEQVTAWTAIEVEGKVRSVAVVGDDAFLLVERPHEFTTRLSIERLDDGLFLDQAVSGRSAVPTAAWSGLGHLEGRDVEVVADGVAVGPLRVAGGAVALPEPAREVQAGLRFAHVVEPLPPNPLAAGGGRGVRLRVVEAAFQLEGTAALRVDMGLGPVEVPLRRLGAGALAGGPPPLVSGERRLRALGWRSGEDRPPWRIEQDAPVPFALLSVTLELKVND